MMRKGRDESALAKCRMKTERNAIDKNQTLRALKPQARRPLTPRLLDEAK